MKTLSKFSPNASNTLEMKKTPPYRYPGNRDSVGIELVGEVDPKTKEYVIVTDKQNASLHWLVHELATGLKVSMQEIFRHPDLSWKMPSEASTAQW